MGYTEYMSTNYTTTDAGTVQLGKQTYTVEIQNHDNGNETIWLTGARGGVYFLRAFTGADTGRRQVISWKSGAPLRVAGNEVRVIQIGSHIEVTK